MSGHIKNGVTRRTMMATMGATMAAGAASVRAAPASDDVALRALLDRSAAADKQRAAVSIKPRAKPFVDPLSDAYKAALSADRRRDRDALRAINRAALPTADRIAYDVFAYRTDQDLAFIASGKFDVARRAPLNPSFGLQVQFPDFVASDAPFATASDYDAGLARLTGFAGYLRDAIVRLREGLAVKQVQPRIVVSNVLAQVDATLALPVERSVFYAAILRLPPAIGATDRQRLTAAYRAAIGREIYPAFAEWKRFLTQDYLPHATEAPGRWAMKDGDALYAAELERETTTRITAPALHSRGLEEVARILKEMEGARAATGYQGDLKAFFNYIRTDPKFYCKTPRELLDRFGAIETKIWRKIPKLFARRPRSQFSVQPLPTLGEQRGTGYYRGGSGDGDPGVLFFNMAMLGTRPIPTLETLTLHEGIAGHHFQIMLARENAKLPPLLRGTGDDNFTAYTEGWGLYSESLGRELGMFEDPYQWFGHLDMEMLRAVRLVVDTGIHALHWSRQRAIDYMLANTSMAPHDVNVEIDRYIAVPGQACAYKVGELRLRELRDKSAARLGAKFDIRDFHDQVLGTGALPMQVLSDKIERWAANGGGPGGSGF